MVWRPPPVITGDPRRWIGRRRGEAGGEEGKPKEEQEIRRAHAAGPAQGSRVRGGAGRPIPVIGLPPLAGQ